MTSWMSSTSPRKDRMLRKDRTSGRDGVDAVQDPGRKRGGVVAALVFVMAMSGWGCQDGEIDENQVCAFQCDYTDVNAVLTIRDVVQVIANAIAEANASGVTNMTVVVNDHLNNVLAVFDTEAATIDFSLITSTQSPNVEASTPFTAAAAPGGANFAALRRPGDALNTALDGIFIPSGYAAISKAGTANYFSTQGNAFTTRTANTLIQQNFVPGETDRPGGPLFAVQIAQLACSDINTRQSVSDQTNTTVAPDPADLIGPRRLPVGFAADPGGIPLYKDGIPDPATGRTGKVVVGAVGIELNGIYALDKDATDLDSNLEERIAFAATRGFGADPERQANRITVAGRALRFVDDTRVRSAAAPVVTAADVVSAASILTFLNGLQGVPPGTGVFRSDQFFFPFTTPRQGVRFLTPQSGVIPAVLPAPPGSGLADATGEILVDSLGVPRFPARNSTSPLPAASGLTAADVQELLVRSLLLAEQTRAQTRTPLGGQARIDVAVVDLDGVVLGFARSQDALLDGIDVTIAKTRQAAFWSKATARLELENALDPLGNAGLLNAKPFDQYVDETAAFLGLPAPAPASLVDPPFNGGIAWSSIGLGGIANPSFPPGILDAGPGPLSRADGEWSVFSTGIQTEVVLPGIAVALCEEVPDLANVLNQLGLVAPLADPFDLSGAGILARQAFCANVRTALIGSADPGQQRTCLQGVQDGNNGILTPSLITGLQNGFHIFQGAFPIYRYDTFGNATLVGAIGVSGDGAEQDDFVPFVALDDVGVSQLRRGVANPIGNAPRGIRADNVEVQNINLRYVICPTAPYLTSNDQSGCEGR